MIRYLILLLAGATIAGETITEERGLWELRDGANVAVKVDGKPVRGATEDDCKASMLRVFKESGLTEGRYRCMYAGTLLTVTGTCPKPPVDADGFTLQGESLTDLCPGGDTRYKVTGSRWVEKPYPACLAVELIAIATCEPLVVDVLAFVDDPAEPWPIESDPIRVCPDNVCPPYPDDDRPPL